MKFRDVNSRDNIEKVYIWTVSNLTGHLSRLVPILRRCQRFAFLPYCYFFLVDWDRCSESKIKVLSDFLYIFFILRDFPDHYFPCRLWEKSREEWPYYYGSNYNPWQRYELRRYVQKKVYEVIFEDKFLFNDVCSAKGINIPRYFGSFGGGSPKLEIVEDIFRENPSVSRLILKPSEGKGGHLIYVVGLNEDSELEILYPSKSPLSVLNDLPGDYLVQEFVNQNSLLSEFSKATNTIRLVTLYTKSGDVLLLGAYLRIGTGDSLVDNLSKGGLAVRIDLDTGRLISDGLDRRGNVYAAHPQSGKVFRSFNLPYWNDIVLFGKSVQKELGYQKLLGMDIAICEDGPTLIEVNSIYDNVDLEQICGPILARKDVWEEYRRYGLLYNRNQMALHEDVYQGVSQ